MTRATIFALASARGRAGVAVVRLSGPGAGAALAALAGPRPAARRAVRRLLTDPDSAEPIDDALVLWMPGPGSFTGEDVVELHVHGSPAVLAALTRVLGAMPGLRPAEAGEFTRRAFEAGRMDLSAAEGLADLIAAETEAQRRLALRQMGGELARRHEAWRQRLIRGLARVEAVLDFPDEGLDDEVVAKAMPDLVALAAELRDALEGGGRGERVRDGFRVAIVGPPNAGKSSLLNRLARREAAIVSTVAGTTRDVIEVAMDLGGYPVLLADTAGLRETGDAVEIEGVRRARARLAEADLGLLVLDATEWPAPEDPVWRLQGPAMLVLANKTDRICAPVAAPIASGCGPVLTVSALTGEGLDGLLSALTDRAARALDVGPAPAITRARHRFAVTQALAALDRGLAGGVALELMAEDLRLSARALGRITGAVDVEDVLDVVFRDFCIGK